jgi:site-specific DNA-methyltransferase (adenine-specific)
MHVDSLPNLEIYIAYKDYLLPYCRTKYEDDKHIIMCDNALSFDSKQSYDLVIADPPYNFIEFNKLSDKQYIDFSRTWIQNTIKYMNPDSSIYVFLGADQKRHFKPLPQIMQMISETNLQSKSFITVRNQRGYGTQKNYMAIRQELLYYILGNPVFNVKGEYTDIPRILQGYYKNGIDNDNRSKSQCIRAGNVWCDIQQVFHLLEENVSGCFAQKPLKAIKRIIEISSNEGDYIFDPFAHSGTTLLACEILNRRCITIDIDPIYCEISIRRLERYRKTGKTGWQRGNAFEKELKNCPFHIR